MSNRQEIERTSCGRAGHVWSDGVRLFGRNAWWERCGGSRGLSLLGAASNEGPGLLRKRVTVDITFSLFHLGVLGPCDEMQLKPHYPSSQERLSRDGDKKFLLIGPPR